MRRTFRALFALIIVVCLVLVASPPQRASAHPMGNFTVNRYSALTLGQDRLDIYYVVDMAEIPAYQELGTIRADHSTELTPAEREAYTARKATELLPGISLSIDGRPTKLTMTDKPALSFPPGTGGLPTLRLELSLVVPLEGTRSGTIEYRDSNMEERIGWKEIIAKPATGVTLDNSTVPATDLSNALRSYPPDLINSPPRVSSASFAFAVTGSAGLVASVPEPVGAVEGDAWGSLLWVRQQTDAITALMQQRELPFGALLAALAIAFMVGSAHALSPGHGKTVVAAYLVGSRGTALHALFLGLTVTLSHTIGVFLLGFVVLFLADYILPETLYPWLNFLSGSLLVVMGLTLFVQRWKTWKSGNAPFAHSHTGHAHAEAHHAHSPGEHAHVPSHESHDHEHLNDATMHHKHGLFGRAHTHLPGDAQKVMLWNLLALGITGGIIPCPSALVVLLVAIASGQIALGLLLILAFSTGLAVVLMGIGLIMVYSRSFFDRFKLRSGRFTGLLGRLPMLSALAVSFLGVLIALRAFTPG